MKKLSNLFLHLALSATILAISHSGKLAAADATTVATTAEVTQQPQPAVTQTATAVEATPVATQSIATEIVQDAASAPTSEMSVTPATNIAPITTTQEASTVPAAATDAPVQQQAQVPAENTPTVTSANEAAVVAAAPIVTEAPVQQAQAPVETLAPSTQPAPIGITEAAPAVTQVVQTPVQNLMPALPAVPRESLGIPLEKRKKILKYSQEKLAKLSIQPTSLRAGFNAIKDTPAAIVKTLAEIKALPDKNLRRLELYKLVEASNLNLGNTIASQADQEAFRELIHEFGQDIKIGNEQFQELIYKIKIDSIASDNNFTYMTNVDIKALEKEFLGEDKGHHEKRNKKQARPQRKEGVETASHSKKNPKKKKNKAKRAKKAKKNKKAKALANEATGSNAHHEEKNKTVKKKKKNKKNNKKNKNAKKKKTADTNAPTPEATSTEEITTTQE